jgi:hypothetical protein
MAPEIGAERYRLIGIGAGELVAESVAGAVGDLFASGPRADAKLEQAVDRIRTRFGDGAIGHGRGLPARRR